MNNILLFILAFIAPLIYWRSLFCIIPHYFEKPFTRTRTGLQVHHTHYGILFVLAASIILLSAGKNYLVIALLGLGLGSILDDLIYSLLMPGNRPLELDIYKKSFSKTVCMFAAVIAVVLLAGFMGNKL